MTYAHKKSADNNCCLRGNQKNLLMMSDLKNYR